MHKRSGWWILCAVLVCVIAFCVGFKQLSAEDFYGGRDTVAHWREGKIQITRSINSAREPCYSLSINGAYVIDISVSAYKEENGFLYVVGDEQICTIDLADLSYTLAERTVDEGEGYTRLK